MIKFRDLSNLDIDSLVILADRWRATAQEERDHGDDLREVWQKIPDSWSGDTAVAAANRIGKLRDDTENHAQQADRIADTLMTLARDLIPAQRALREAVHSAHQQGIDVVFGHAFTSDDEKQVLVPAAQKAIDAALEAATEADRAAAEVLGLQAEMHRGEITPEVMDLLERSFTPQEIATMEPGRLRSILDVCQRMHDAGIDLSRIEKIKGSWNANTDGVDFALREPLNLPESQFVHDPLYPEQHLFGGQEPFPPGRTVAHRQMSPDGESPALHVLQKDDGHAQVHIDFVPVVEGRNDDGTPDYIVSNVPEHISKDLKGWTHEDDIFDRYNKLKFRAPEIEEKLRELAWQGGKDTPESRRLTREIEEMLAAKEKL